MYKRLIRIDNAHGELLGFYQRNGWVYDVTFEIDDGGAKFFQVRSPAAARQAIWNMCSKEQTTGGNDEN